MVIAAPPSTAISAGSREARIFLLPTTPATKPEIKAPLPALFQQLAFSSLQQISEHPLLAAPAEGLSDYERGRQGEIRLGKLTWEVFGDNVAKVVVTAQSSVEDFKGLDVIVIFKPGYHLDRLYGQSKLTDNGVRRHRVKVRKKENLANSEPETVRRIIAGNRMMVVNTSGARTDEEVKDSIWKEVSLVYEVHGLLLPIRADKEVVVFAA